MVILKSHQGAIAVNDNISSYGDVSLAAVTTGYLRSDGYGIEGKIYLQAFGYIRVIGSFKYFTDYSIYTGDNCNGSDIKLWSGIRFECY